MTKTTTITLDTFLKAVFDGRQNDQHILLAKQTDLGGSFFHAPHPTEARWRRGKVATYYNVSTVKVPEPEADGSLYWHRRKTDCVEAYVLVLDDVGTKAATPPVEPSYKLESSPGNHQWGFFIEPTSNLDRYSAIVEAICELGWGDKGAGGYNRLMRVPGSVNLKPGRDGFVSTVTDWHPERVWDLDELATALGVDLAQLNVKKTQVKPATAGAAVAATAIADPVLTWLADNGMVVTDKDEWVEITCPWHDSHTTGSDIAGYSPLGRGAEWHDHRAFKCLHEHCRERDTAQFLRWVNDQGGPWATGFDPLPRLQQQYVLVIDGMRVADLWQRQNGGMWTNTLPEWKLKNPGRMRMLGRDNPISVMTAFTESRQTRRAETMLFRPGEPELAEVNDQIVVNTWVPPRWPETDETPTAFLEHVEFILPDKAERELFLDWLAWKFQHPGMRSYSVLMVAPTGAQGLGRSMIGDFISAAIGSVNTVDLDKLIGNGSFNDYLFDCTFLVVEEAKDVAHEDFWRGYEKLKERLDNRANQEWRNTKYGKARFDTKWFNAMVFSNHADALAIPPEDRRFLVLTNPDARRDKDYYQRIHDALRGDEPGKLYWYLMRRNVAGYDHVYPPMTKAKEMMQDMAAAPSDEIGNLALADLPGDLITLAQIKIRVRAAAKEVGLSKVEQAPDGVARRLFKKYQRLRKDKNGARYVIRGQQEEVRAIRNLIKWSAVDVSRDTVAVAEEVAKNDRESLNVLNFPKLPTS